MEKVCNRKKERKSNKLDFSGANNRKLSPVSFHPHFLLHALNVTYIPIVHIIVLKVGEVNLNLSKVKPKFRGKEINLLRNAK